MPSEERVEAKLDALTGAISSLAVKVGVVESVVEGMRKAVEGNERLVSRIEMLEGQTRKRWELLPTWIASGIALLVAALPYIHFGA